ncbi:hypothetical protein XANCAGTX0491_002745 [Xanthoria calcicola]
MSTATVPTTFLIISDTHDFTPTSAPIFPLHLPTPKADVLLHSGDLTSAGDLSSLRKALTVLASIPAELKLAIAGNHDLHLDQSYRTKKPATPAPGNNPQEDERPDLEYHAKAMGLMTGELVRQAGVTYLVEGTHEFTLASGATFKIYVSPYTPEFGDWAFAYALSEDRFNTPEDVEKGSKCKSIAINPIPEDVDIVMTHGPPQGILDLCAAGNVGCPHLLRAMKRVRPMIHCFGHVHEGSGIEVVDWKVKEKEAAKEEKEAMERGGGARRKNEAVHRAFEVEWIENPYPGVWEWRVGKGWRKGETTLAVNASIMDADYKPRNAPWRVVVDLKRVG